MDHTSFADTLRQAIERRGLSLAALRRRLQDVGAGVSESTLSQWRSGHRRPEGAASMVAVESLEDILGLETGELSRRLGPSRRFPVQKPVDSAMMYPAGTRAALRELGFSARRELVETLATHIIDVDAEGCVERIANQTVYRAVGSGRLRFPTYLEAQRPLPRPVRFTAVHGCEIGRTITPPDHRYTAAECVIPTPLEAGDTVTTEVHATDLSADRDGTFYEMHASRRLREAMVVVRFADDCVPAALWGYTESDDDGLESHPLRRAASAHVWRTGYGPGKLGVRWEW